MMKDIDSKVATVLLAAALSALVAVGGFSLKGMSDHIASAETVNNDQASRIVKLETQEVYNSQQLGELNRKVDTVLTRLEDIRNKR